MSRRITVISECRPAVQHASPYAQSHTCLLCLARPSYLPATSALPSELCTCGMITAVTILTLLLLPPPPPPRVVLSPPFSNTREVIFSSFLYFLFSISVLSFASPEIFVPRAQQPSVRSEFLAVWSRARRLAIGFDSFPSPGLGTAEILFSLGVGPRIATQVTESKLQQAVDGRGTVTGT